MRLRSAALRGIRLRLSSPLDTAHGAISERRGWLLRLEDSDGYVGLGEATPLPEFGTEALESAEQALVDGVETLLRSDLNSDLMSMLDHPSIERRMKGTPNASAALECALFDLCSRREGISLGKFCCKHSGSREAPQAEIDCQALIGGDTPARVFESASRYRGEAFGTYKLKLAVSPGSWEAELDRDRVASLREAVGSEARIRLDANEAWTFDQACTALEALADFDVDYVEQPIDRNDLAGLATLDAGGPIRIAADESLLGEGLERCLSKPPTRIFIVKPAAIGGIRAAMRVADRAQSQGIRMIWSSLIDGAVSRQAALHLAAALGREQESHGLSTGRLLINDFESEVAGRLPVPTSPGLGLDSLPYTRGEFEGDAPIWASAARHFEAP